MALVVRIIGDCPGCKKPKCFGNYSVHNCTVFRGCGYCNYRERVRLPPIKKKILYLDQFCFSRPFRMQDPKQDRKYEEVIERLKQLAQRQVLVVPYSSVHEDETHIWAGDGKKTHDDLMKYIKQVAGGHEMEPHYEVQRSQLASAFEAFLSNKLPVEDVDPSDALPDDFHDWANYMWVDIGGYFGDAEAIEHGKRLTTEELIKLLPIWRASPDDFDGDVAREYLDAARSYLKTFIDYVMRVGGGDVSGLLYSPIKSAVVETLWRCFPESTPDDDRLPTISRFFRSDHFYLAPYEWISARAFAVLRDRVRKGAYANPSKASHRLSGLFPDIEHVATYAPYCDAIFIDNAMEEMMRDPRLNIAKRYGTKVFCEAKWDELLEWLEGLDANLPAEHEQGLLAAYPTSVA